MTTAKNFGGFVVEGNRLTVLGMQDPAEFTTYPLLDLALRASEAEACRAYDLANGPEVPSGWLPMRDPAVRQEL